MRTRNLFAAFFAVVVLTASCDEGGDSETKQPVVYVAGMEDNAQGVTVAKLWKDSSEHLLSDGAYNTWARAVAVADNGDVYVAGVETLEPGSADTSAKEVVTLWKNSIPQRLSSNSGNAIALHVEGSDVYVAGADIQNGSAQYATIWKNGVAQYLNEHSKTRYLFGLAHSVCVVGSDVYASGLETDSTYLRPTIWKNGEAQYLDSIVIYSLRAAGNDVYGAGNKSAAQGRQVPILWKNGEVQLLSDDQGLGMSVCVSGSDVYVAGHEVNAQGRYVAMLWKNGAAQRLSDGNTNAQANSAYAYGGDVYVAGYEVNVQGKQVAILWKNGIPQPLSNGSSHASASSVFVR